VRKEKRTIKIDTNNQMISSSASDLAGELNL
jgi:hypothetical protein